MGGLGCPPPETNVVFVWLSKLHDLGFVNHVDCLWLEALARSSDFVGRSQSTYGHTLIVLTLGGADDITRKSFVDWVACRAPSRRSHRRSLRRSLFLAGPMQSIVNIDV